MQFDDPATEFVTGMTMMSVLQEFAEREGYTEIPRIQHFRDSWLRTEASMIRQDHMRDRIISDLTAEEMQFWNSQRADSVRLTLECDSIPSVEMGLFRLSHIPHHIAVDLDSRSAGTAIELERGLRIRLDQMIRGDAGTVSPLLTPDGNPDSTEIWVLSEGRLRFINLLERYDAIDRYGISIDTVAVLAVASYFDARTAVLPVDTVLSSRLVTTSSLDLATEMAFFQTRLPLMANNPVWCMMTLDNIIMQTIRMQELSEGNPVLMDSLAEEADKYLMELALQAVYSDSVTSSLSITEEDLQFEYSQMDSTIMVPEKRILLALHLPFEQEEAWMASVNAGTQNTFAESLEGLSFLSPDGSSSRITAPVSEQELPENTRELVFSHSSDDSSYIGPIPSSRLDGFELYRVLEVLPEHAAEMEEVRSALRSSALERLEVLRIEEWMQGLKDEYGFLLNTAHLTELPSDPGLWASAD